jgi:hydroxyacylglutathione hydrolase
MAFGHMSPATASVRVGIDGPAASRSGPRIDGVCVPDVVVLRTSRGNMTNYNYLIADPVERRCVLLDPAWEIDTIRRAVADSGAALAGILLTHAHADHVDLAPALAEETGCTVWMSAAEIAATGFDCAGLTPIEESPLRIGRMLVQPLLTPGHTPGSVCYRIGDNLFTGDVLFAEGCGLCPDTEGAYRMHDSLERLKGLLAPTTRIFPGHSFGRPPGQRFADVLQENIYLHFRDRDHFASFRLRAGQIRAKQFDFR